MPAGRGLGKRASTHVRCPDPHYNPLPCILSVDSEEARYLRAPSALVWPIMTLRSAHLPGDHTAQAVEAYAGDECMDCRRAVLTPAECVSDDERRWRHIQHRLFACESRGCGPPMSCLRDDAVRAAFHAGCPDLAAAVEAALSGDMHDVAAVRGRAVPFLLDPVRFCEGHGGTAAAARGCHRVCAAFCVGVAAGLSGLEVDAAHLRAIALPRGSGLAAHLERCRVGCDSDGGAASGDDDDGYFGACWGALPREGVVVAPQVPWPSGSDSSSEDEVDLSVGRGAGCAGGGWWSGRSRLDSDSDDEVVIPPLVRRRVGGLALAVRGPVRSRVCARGRPLGGELGVASCARASGVARVVAAGSSGFGAVLVPPLSPAPPVCSQSGSAELHEADARSGCGVIPD